jgi:hypothetical protein
LRLFSKPLPNVLTPLQASFDFNDTVAFYGNDLGLDFGFYFDGFRAPKPCVNSGLLLAYYSVEERTFFMKQNRLKSFLAPTLLATSFILNACGPQAFVPNTTTSSQSAAGGMNVPPKIDIVLGMSSNGTMRNIYPGVQNEIPKFLKNLQNSGWDYRFVSLPLSQYHPTANLSISGAVSVSNYDASYPIGTWLAPFPGALHDTSPSIVPYLFANVFNVSELSPSDPIDNHESGFRNQLDFLGRADVQSDFLRPDAMLAVMTISNADDRSDWAWGQTGTAQQGTPTVDSSTYAAMFRAVKGGSGAALKYFSVVAAPATTCRGYGMWSGLRYQDMANRLNGTSVDICNTSVGDSLTAIQNNLTTYRLTFRKKYLVIGSEPNIGTITVTRYSNGQKSVIPQDPTNGWTYDGAVPQGGTYTIDSPIPMDKVTSGYLIELHGTAELTNSDTADVNYQNAGTVSSH